VRGRRAALLALGAVACARPGAKPAALVPPLPPAVWSYEVALQGDDLDVTATFPRGIATTLSLEERATPFVSDLAVDADHGPPLAARGGIWTVPTCARGCTLHYRFRLGEAARSLDDIDSAAGVGGCVEAPPSTWLLRPTDHAATASYRFHVTTAAGAHFASGVRSVPGAADTYGADADDLDTAPYSLFGPFRARTLRRGAATIELAIVPGKLALDDAGMDRWIALSADAIEAYYGRFPVPRVLLIAVPAGTGHGEMVEGRTLASGGASIFLGVSPTMTAADIPADWVLTHEMTHLALPSLRREYHWLEEGLATYVEPLARAKVGTIPEAEVWRGLVEGLPNGEPAAGDEGLDRTHTWGRTYWGGALFSFMADLEIRKRTGNKLSLADALRGILANGGNGEASWSLEQVLEMGDKAVGVPVLEELHAAWGTTPVAVDLPHLWSELGVRSNGKSLAWDERAPLAGVRKAMTKR
jgi:hypothetical protein